jgi:uncharacterized membrane protein YhaH (DUF805 family)
VAITIEKQKEETMNGSAKRKLRPRFWMETLLAAITGILCAITPIWPDWIEAISGWDPDQHNGSMEWMITVGLLIVTVAMVAMAVRDWRRMPVTESG